MLAPSMARQNAPPKEDDQPPDPTADWPAWAPGVLAALRHSPNVSAAAKTCDVARSTINRLVQRDEAFAIAAHDAREEALDSLEDVILERAREGQQTVKVVTRTAADGSIETTVTEESHISDTLAMFFLKRWRPEYRESYRIENTGPGGGPIQIEIEGKLNDAVARFESEVVRLAALVDAGDPPS